MVERARQYMKRGSDISKNKAVNQRNKTSFSDCFTAVKFLSTNKLPCGKVPHFVRMQPKSKLHLVGCGLSACHVYVAHPGPQKDLQLFIQP